MTIEEWANKHKKAFAREFIRHTNYQKSNSPTGIFTAGLPGAGKTEFTVALISELSRQPVRIDMDEIAEQIEGYNPRKADLFRGGASIIMSRIYDLVLKEGYDFVFDGTFSSAGSLPNVERALRHRYKVKIYYIHQEPELAWKFTQAREVVEHRAIDGNGFCETYKKLEDNLRKLQSDFKDVTISLIVKDNDNKVGLRKEDVEDIFEELPKFLTAEEIRNVIV